MTSAHDRQSGPNQPQSTFLSTDRRNVLLCIALLVVAAAVTNPRLEMGVNDDWSYAHTAREFASSGHIAYNGWAVAMLLPQIVWASLFIKLFGFSFFILRISTLVLGVFTVPVLYYLGRESGLAPPFATFATLLTALSPLVLPQAVSFMSDVPAFFLFMLCFYGGVKSWKASTTRTCIEWAGLVVLAGILSGMNRQIYWLAPLLFLPVIAWIQRRKRGAAAGLSAGWLLTGWLFTIMAVGCSILWYQAQPYSLAEHAMDAWRHSGLRSLVGQTLNVTAGAGLTTGLILLPLLVGYVAVGFKAASPKLLVVALAVVMAGEYVFAVRLSHRMPSLGNILTEYGILPPETVAIGARPVILGAAGRDLLTMAVLLCCAGCALALWKGRRTGGSRLWQDPVAPTFVLGALFAAGWLPPMLYRSQIQVFYDRHLIAFMPLVAIPLLRYYQEHLGPRVNRWSWAVLALFALYGVATTHDLFAADRARLEAAGNLEQAGIPRNEITAGFEYDGETQVDAMGYVYNKWIDNPAGAYRPLKCIGPDSIRLWSLGMMPAIRARYFVVLSRSPELEDGPAAPVGYITWLPTGRRQVFTQKLPEGYAGCQ
jgi:hypothetical protein